LPFAIVIAMASKGVTRAARDDPHLMDGLNIHRGMLTERPVAEAQGRDYVPALDAIGA
jgi:alanine dehydrogenase